MPRSPRIEYPNAFYHIMNRGKGRQDIFHSKEYYNTFLNILSESRQKFGIVIHAYCLMTNHYHLIIETPNSNLSRAMRHINGVYTQRYNRLKKTDGSLFRGRFKSILIDEDLYLLNLSRYIHRNPRNLVKNLEDYKWSSYPAYLGLEKPAKWLYRDKIAESFAGSYKAYVMANEDGDNFKKHYNDKENFPMILGSDNFRKKIHSQISKSDNINKDEILTRIRGNFTIDEVIEITSKAFNVPKHLIKNRQVGKVKSNFVRKFAMYLCHIYFQKTLSEIAMEFGLKSSGSVSKAIFLVKSDVKKSTFEYKREMDYTISGLWK